MREQLALAVVPPLRGLSLQQISPVGPKLEEQLITFILPQIAPNCTEGITLIFANICPASKKAENGTFTETTAVTKIMFISVDKLLYVITNVQLTLKHITLCVLC